MRNSIHAGRSVDLGGQKTARRTDDRATWGATVEYAPKMVRHLRRGAHSVSMSVYGERHGKHNRRGDRD